MYGADEGTMTMMLMTTEPRTANTPTPPPSDLQREGPSSSLSREEQLALWRQQKSGKTRRRAKTDKAPAVKPRHAHFNATTKTPCQPINGNDFNASRSNGGTVGSGGNNNHNKRPPLSSSSSSSAKLHPRRAPIPTACGGRRRTTSPSFPTAGTFAAEKRGNGSENLGEPRQQQQRTGAAAKSRRKTISSSRDGGPEGIAALTRRTREPLGTLSRHIQPSYARPTTASSSRFSKTPPGCNDPAGVEDDDDSNNNRDDQHRQGHRRRQHVESPDFEKKAYRPQGVLGIQSPAPIDKSGKTNKKSAQQQVGTPPPNGILSSMLSPAATAWYSLHATGTGTSPALVETELPPSQSAIDCEVFWTNRTIVANTDPAGIERPSSPLTWYSSQSCQYSQESNDLRNYMEDEKDGEEKFDDNNRAVQDDPYGVRTNGATKKKSNVNRGDSPRTNSGVESYPSAGARWHKPQRENDDVDFSVSSTDEDEPLAPRVGAAPAGPIPPASLMKVFQQHFHQNESRPAVTYGGGGSRHDLDTIASSEVDDDEIPLYTSPWKGIVHGPEDDDFVWKKSDSPDFDGEDTLSRQSSRRKDAADLLLPVPSLRHDTDTGRGLLSQSDEDSHGDDEDELDAFDWKHSLSPDYQALRRPHPRTDASDLLLPVPSLRQEFDDNGCSPERPEPSYNLAESEKLSGVGGANEKRGSPTAAVVENIVRTALDAECDKRDEEPIYVGDSKPTDVRSFGLDEHCDDSAKFSGCGVDRPDAGMFSEENGFIGPRDLPKVDGRTVLPIVPEDIALSSKDQEVQELQKQMNQLMREKQTMLNQLASVRKPHEERATPFRDMFQEVRFDDFTSLFHCLPPFSLSNIHVRFWLAFFFRSFKRLA